MKKMILSLVGIAAASQAQAHSLCRQHIEEVAELATKHAQARGVYEKNSAHASLESAITRAELVCASQTQEGQAPQGQMIDSNHNDCKVNKGE